MHVFADCALASAMEKVGRRRERKNEERIERDGGKEKDKEKGASNRATETEARWER